MSQQVFVVRKIGENILLRMVPTFHILRGAAEVSPARYTMGPRFLNDVIHKDFRLST